MYIIIQYKIFNFAIINLFKILVKETNFTGCDGESRIFEYNHKLLVR